MTGFRCKKYVGQSGVVEVLVLVLVLVLVEVEVEVPSHSSLEAPHGPHSQFGPIGACPPPQQQHPSPHLFPVSPGQHGGEEHGL